VAHHRGGVGSDGARLSQLLFKKLNQPHEVSIFFIGGIEIPYRAHSNICNSAPPVCRKLSIEIVRSKMIDASQSIRMLEPVGLSHVLTLVAPEFFDFADGNADHIPSLKTLEHGTRRRPKMP
jgi:hypothetical protein